MGTNTKIVKTNEQYLIELQEGGKSMENLHPTPYPNLSILFDPVEVEDSYKDEDGDWWHPKKIVIARKAFIKLEDGRYSFLLENWFDDIDNFETGLYAKVKLGDLYNFINPLGEYLFPFWYNEIEFHGGSLFYCYSFVMGDKPNVKPVSHSNLHHNNDSLTKIVTIYDKRGQLLFDDVIVHTDFINGRAVLSKDGLYNYINEMGQLVLPEWVLDAKAFVQIRDLLYAFVKTETGWGVIDDNGDFISPQTYTSIEKAEWRNYNSYGRRFAPIAVINDKTGQNILVKNYKYEDEDKDKDDDVSLTLGLRDSANAIYFIDLADVIMIKTGKVWEIVEWDANLHVYESKIKLGELDNVDNNLIQLYNGALRIIQKGEMYNVVGQDGIILNEWYSAIELVGNLFKVQRKSEILELSKNEDELNNLFEYNLVTFGGKYILEDWSRNITIIPYQGAFIINLEPQLATYNGKVYDRSIIYEDNSSSQIKRVNGLCNVMIDENLLFKSWHRAVEFVNGQIFTDGYLKVWKDEKCNLINKQGEYASSEWMDDFIVSKQWENEYHYRSYLGAFEVKNNNKVNLLLNDNLLLNQWFTQIKWRDDSDGPVFDVQDGHQKGVYYLSRGLLGTRLYDSIWQISERLFLCEFDGRGHIINLNSEIVTSAPIAQVYPFRNGYALVKAGREYGYSSCSYQYNYINSNGQLVFPDWFELADSHSYQLISTNQVQFLIIRRGDKFNIITSDKKLLFSDWYDSISGNDEKWIISDKSRGECKYNFVNSEGKLLSEDWFEEVKKLNNLNDGIYVVKKGNKRNIFGSNNKYTLADWTEYDIKDTDCHLPALVYFWYMRTKKLCYINREGYIITPYWTYEDSENSVKRYYHSNEYLLIIGLFEEDPSKIRIGTFPKMQIICKEDGTPFFRDIIRTSSRSSIISPNDNFTTSVFGSIDEYLTLDKRELLLVNKHWPYDDFNDIPQYVIMDYEGKELSEEFEHIGEFNESGYAVVKKDGRFNVIDKDFQLISLLWFSNLGYEYKTMVDDWEEYIDEDTEMIEVRPIQEERVVRTTSFHDGLLKVELNGSYNMMNQRGELIFPLWYDKLTILHGGFYIVEINSKFNIIDKSNNAVSDIWFDKMMICQRDKERIVYACKLNNLYKLLFFTESFVVISEAWTDRVFRYKRDGYYPVSLNGKKNLITDNGKLLMPEWHEDLKLFFEREYANSDSFAYVVVKDKDKYNIFSTIKSEMLSQDGYDNVLSSKGLFCYGWCGVQIGGKYTFVNMDGKLADGRYDSICDYSGGFAGVVLDGRKNYLDSDGKLISEVWYDEISAFTWQKEKAVVKRLGKLNVIDTTGKELLPDNIQPILAIDLIESSYCLLSLTGEDGEPVHKYYDFNTGQLHNSESEVKDYLNKLNDEKSNSDKIEEDTVVSNDMETIDDSNKIKRDDQIQKLIKRWGTLGINYTLVGFGRRRNLVDSMGYLLFEEWIDSSDLIMNQGVPLMKNKDNRWIIVK